MSTPSERSVDWLQKLYAVVVGLALTEGLKNAVVAANSALPAGSMVDKALRQETCPIVALIFTIVPFFHGANRHLDDVYIFRRCGAKDFALLIDFFLLFLEGTVFYWLALVMATTQKKMGCATYEHSLRTPACRPIRFSSGDQNQCQL